MKHYKLILILGLLTVILAGCASQTSYLKVEPSLMRGAKTFDGQQYVELAKVCDAYGLKLEWDEFLKKAVVEKGSRRIALRSGSDRILVAGSEKRLDSPTVLDGGRLFVPVSFVRKDLGYIAGEAVSQAPEETVFAKGYTIKRVVLDAGHGGKDPGAISRKLRLVEKRMTLSIAKKLKTILESNGINVVMTRSSDVYVPLSRRVDMANRSSADLFISIHVNASRSRRLKGFECYYLADTTDDNALALKACENPPPRTDAGTIAFNSRNLSATLWDMVLSENRRESADLSASICESIEKSLTIASRGVKSARFYVLKYARIPAVLVEMGYLSNRYEEIKLKDTDFVDRITGAVARGVISYKREYEETDGFTRGMTG